MVGSIQEDIFGFSTYQSGHFAQKQAFARPGERSLRHGRPSSDRQHIPWDFHFLRQFCPFYRIPVHIRRTPPIPAYEQRVPIHTVVELFSSHGFSSESTSSYHAGPAGHSSLRSSEITNCPVRLLFRAVSGIHQSTLFTYCSWKPNVVNFQSSSLDPRRSLGVIFHVGLYQTVHRPTLSKLSALVLVLVAIPAVCYHTRPGWFAIPTVPCVHYLLLPASNPVLLLPFGACSRYLLWLNIRHTSLPFENIWPNTCHLAFWLTPKSAEDPLFIVAVLD